MTTPNSSFDLEGRILGEADGVHIPPEAKDGSTTVLYIKLDTIKQLISEVVDYCTPENNPPNLTDGQPRHYVTGYLDGFGFATDHIESKKQELGLTGENSK